MLFCSNIYKENYEPALAMTEGILSLTIQFLAQFTTKFDNEEIVVWQSVSQQPSRRVGKVWGNLIWRCAQYIEGLYTLPYSLSLVAEDYSPWSSFKCLSVFLLPIPTNSKQVISL